jgi:hypothetical protein
MRKKILGLKLSGPKNNGKSITSGDVAWALIEEMEKEGKIENISPEEVAKTARKAIGFLF